MSIEEGVQDCLEWKTLQVVSELLCTNPYCSCTRTIIQCDRAITRRLKNKTYILRNGRTAQAHAQVSAKTSMP